MRRFLKRKDQRTQLKHLATSDTGGGQLATDCTFSGLVVGQWYRLSGNIAFRANVGGANDPTVTVTITNGSNTLNVTSLTGAQAAGAGVTFTTTRTTHGVYSLFQASATTVVPTASDASATSSVTASTSATVLDGTFFRLEIVHGMKTTTAFT